MSEPGGPHATVYRDTLPACAECEIHVRSLGSFGALSDSILLREPSVKVLRDGFDRTYATVPNVSDHEILVYDRTGQIVRTVGRRGEGPGEFRAVADMYLGAGDSLYVLEPRGRLSVFDSSGVSVRTISLDPAGFMTAGIVHADGTGITLNTEFREPTLREHPFHRYRADGGYVEGFGPRGDYETVMEEDGRTVTMTMSRATSFDPDRDILWIHTGTVGYRLDAIDHNGSVTRRIGLNSGGWRGMAPLQMTPDDVRARLEERRRGSSSRSGPGWDPESRPDRPSGPTPAAINGIHALENGLLLVALRVAGREWDQDRFEYDTTFPLEPQLMPHSIRRRWDSVLDLIDTASGELLARTELEGRVTFGRDGTLYRVLVAETGLITVEVLEAAVVVPEPRRSGRSP